MSGRVWTVAAQPPSAARYDLILGSESDAVTTSDFEFSLQRPVQLHQHPDFRRPHQKLSNELIKSKGST